LKVGKIPSKDTEANDWNFVFPVDPSEKTSISAGRFGFQMYAYYIDGLTREDVKAMGFKTGAASTAGDALALPLKKSNTIHLEKVLNA
jgi:hypothetical protein